MNKKVAKALCDANVIKFGSFTLSSGRTSPVYVDIRILPSTPSAFQTIADELAKAVKGIDASIVAGAETAGIPLAAAIALKNKMPMIYVRKRPKQYGTISMIEGVLEQNDKVVLVDDMATDGRSKIIFIDGIRAAGGKVEDAIIVLDREQGAKETMKQMGVNLHSLITLREILEYMKEEGTIDDSQYDKVMDYLGGGE